MITFYDFEVFKHDWLVVFINLQTQSETVIINDPKRLQEYYEAHETDIYIGYNNKNYDQYIFKAILCGFDPYKVSKYIIKQNNAGWAYSDLFRNFPIINYDLMQANDRGLKSLEGFMGNDIRETSVDFEIDRRLTPAEIAETVKYCRHDVEQTVEVWLRRKGSFTAMLNLIQAFSLPITDVSKTETQLTAKILGATRRHYDDEFDISIPKTLQLKKYKHVQTWFEDPKNHWYSRKNERGKKIKNKLEITVAGVPHTFAWGGVHGAIPQYHGKGYFLMIDVTSLYPSLMIIYELISRSCADPQKYVDIYQTNIEMKKTGDPLRPAYKLVCNKAYGAMKDVNNPLYDPRQANNVCIHGQLLLLDLIEKLEPHCQLIQSNTDGLLIKMREPDTEANRDKFFEKIDSIVQEWEDRTGLVMEFEEYTEIYQKDVNNYVAISIDGKVKRKGSYVKKLHELDNDLPIVNEALVAYMVEGIAPEITIGKCNELIKFQKIAKVSGKYQYAYHGDRRQSEKCFRVFASTSRSDRGIGKQKHRGATVEKFANTPERCFVENGVVQNVPVPKKLDRQWYINLCYERLRQFGV